jgi:hypothetical protein
MECLVRTKETWSVVVVYEDSETRELAMAFCDRMVRRYWAKLDFDVSWWSFDSLAKADSAKSAATKTVSADLLLFATRPENELPFHIRTWSEAWIPERSEREGSLVGLPTPDVGDRPESTATRAYLRALAHRAGMDYLTEFPEDLTHLIPESLEVYAERANQVTTVLDEILNQPALPPR